MQAACVYTSIFYQIERLATATVLLGGQVDIARRGGYAVYHHGFYPIPAPCSIHLIGNLRYMLTSLLHTLLILSTIQLQRYRTQHGPRHFSILGTYQERTSRHLSAFGAHYMKIHACFSSHLNLPFRFACGHKAHYTVHSGRRGNVHRMYTLVTR
jgi:hypothetical protein